MLQDFRKEFDSSSLDYNDRDEIEKRLEVIKNDAHELGNTDELREAQRELEVFSLNKSIKTGLTPLFSGTGNDKEGKEIDFCWPDIKSFSDSDWEMIENRYNETSNPYGKYVYGMTLFLIEKRKDNHFVLKLIQNILPLLDNYYYKSLDDDKNKTNYIQFYLNLLWDVFALAERRKKSNSDIDKLFVVIKKKIYANLLAIDVKIKEAPYVITSLTSMIVDNYSDFHKIVDIDLVLMKSKEVLELQKDVNNYDVKEVASTAIKLSLKASKDVAYWHRMIAESYELMAEKRGGMVSPEFYVTAMRHYKILKDDKKLKEIHAKLNKTKKQMEFGTISHTLPRDIAKMISDYNVNQAAQLTSEEILKELSEGVKLPRFSVFKKKEDENPNLSLFKMVSIDSYDKHGNKNFSTNPKDASDSAYYISYKLEFQIPSKINFYFFIESVKARKINYIEIEKWIKKSWIGNEYIRVYNGFSRTVIPYDLLRPGIKLLMNEFEKLLSPSFLKNTQSDMDEFICGIDSLSPKVEYLFRILFEEKLELPTTRTKDDGTWEEKMLTELLNDLRDYIKVNVDEPYKSQLLDDISFIDFVMNHRAGFNIRNQVAHSHFDKEEYSADKAVLVLCVLLRMSSWTVNSFNNNSASAKQNSN